MWWGGGWWVGGGGVAVNPHPHIWFNTTSLLSRGCFQNSVCQNLTNRSLPASTVTDTQVKRTLPLGCEPDTITEQKQEWIDPRRTYQVFGSVRHIVPDGGAEGVVAGHDVPQHVHLLPVPERGRPAEPGTCKCSVFTVYHWYSSGEAVLLLGFQKK